MLRKIVTKDNIDKEKYNKERIMKDMKKNTDSKQ